MHELLAPFSERATAFALSNQKSLSLSFSLVGGGASLRAVPRTRTYARGRARERAAFIEPPTPSVARSSLCRREPTARRAPYMYNVIHVRARAHPYVYLYAGLCHPYNFVRAPAARPRVRAHTAPPPLKYIHRNMYTAPAMGGSLVSYECLIACTRSKLRDTRGRTRWGWCPGSVPARVETLRRRTAARIHIIRGRTRLVRVNLSSCPQVVV